MGQYKLKQRGFYYFNSIPALAFVCECVCVNVCVSAEPPWCKRREEAAQTSQPGVTLIKTLKPVLACSRFVHDGGKKQPRTWKRLLKLHFWFKSVGGRVIGAANRGTITIMQNWAKEERHNSKFCVCVELIDEVWLTGCYPWQHPALP